MITDLVRDQAFCVGWFGLMAFVWLGWAPEDPASPFSVGLASVGPSWTGSSSWQHLPSNRRFTGERCCGLGRGHRLESSA